jgi:hypothetical protein
VTDNPAGNFWANHTQEETDRLFAELMKSAKNWTNAHAIIEKWESVGPDYRYDRGVTFYGNPLEDTEVDLDA